jgi:hypothetical protein
MTHLGRTLFAAAWACLCVEAGRGAEQHQITVDPPAVKLSGPGARYSLLVHGRGPDGRVVDRTHAARYRSLDPRVARVTNDGIVHAVGDGTTAVVVLANGRSLNVPVTVEKSAAPRRFHFENDVIPLLSRFGCNSSGCHGKAEGQNGFKLSVFGFDPAADHAALVKESRGRRILAAAPEGSLLLRKVSGQAPHGGGARIRTGTNEYETLRGWIAAGAPLGSASEPGVVAVRVEPTERVLAMRGSQQLRVVARYADGREVDVTAHARFQSNNDALAAVDERGQVTAGELPGEAAVLASFLNVMATFRATVPRPGRIDPYPSVPENNFIDRLVFARLRKLNIVPSELADDATYLRRVYLDLIGTLPAAAEARCFLADKRADRRARLVEELLGRAEFADYWTMKWADLLRVERTALGAKRARAYHKWIREQVAANVPFDKFARAVVTAEGPVDEVPPAAFYKAVSKPGEAASTLAQVFLGLRIACAECHHHPFDRWSQDDYHGLSAFFTNVRVHGAPGGETLVAEGQAMAQQPRTGKMIWAHPLSEKPPAKLSEGDRRRELADWMTSPKNPWFARNLANRVWAHLLGRGLVEPIDDVRETNPPSNPELLDALARHAVENKFDVKALIRTITASRTYQLSSKPNTTNERDAQNYSRALFKRLPAEVLLDMVSQVSGVEERFRGFPPGTRAIRLWDNKVPHYFLKTFGRPERSSACACERNEEPGVAQVLHLLNAPEVQAKLSHAGGALAKMVKRHTGDGPLVEELYLTFLSRPPDDRERKVALEHLAAHKKNRREAVEDLAWSLLNTLEFAFNH